MAGEDQLQEVEGLSGWMGEDLLESLESCEAGGGLQHDEGLLGGGPLLEWVDAGLRHVAVGLVGGEVEQSEGGWAEGLVDLLGNE